MPRLLQIPGSTYSASADGQIISPRGLPLKPFRSGTGGHVKVCIDGGRRIFVHRLVALAFHGPCPDGQEVRHRNGNPIDNRAENLEYGTRSQNVLDAVRHGTYRNAGAEKTHCVNGHEYTPSNTYRARGVGARRCRECKRTERRR